MFDPALKPGGANLAEQPGARLRVLWGLQQERVIPPPG